MSNGISKATVREWIDDDLVAGVESITDEHAEFNLIVQLSGMMIHVIQRRDGGPLLVGQQIEFDDEIRQRLGALSPNERAELLGQIRRALMETGVVYGFRNQRGENVSFREMHHVFLERRVYPNSASQQVVMDALIEVWKTLRYLDDMPELIDRVAGTDGTETNRTN